MKVSQGNSILALALWHVGCDGARVGAPKQQEGSFSNNVAPYNYRLDNEETIFIPDESESYVRITPRELVAFCHQTRTISLTLE
jgi:hypothetical protein